jgi:uncharacterized repeat protein (TIGR01451 family)
MNRARIAALTAITAALGVMTRAGTVRQHRGSAVAERGTGIGAHREEKQYLMIPRGLPWLPVVALLVLGSLPAGAVAQSAPPTDPQQFPALANSKFFQESDWAFQQRAYPVGFIPAGARERALQQIRQSKAAMSPAASAAAAVAGDTWTSIGPAPVLGGQTPSSRAVSGRIASAAVDPSNAAHWLVGAAQGGVWETTDSGSTWAARTDAQASLAMGAIAFARSNPSTIYAGTGEANFSGDSYEGAGLLKSTDGGTNWQLLAAATFAKNGFSAIKVDPGNSNTVLAATTRAIAGRENAYAPAIPPQGVFRSTDGGTTWAQTLIGEATELAVDPTNFTRQYAGLGEIFGETPNGVYRSTDGGQTWAVIGGPWTSLSGGVGRVALAIAPSNPNRVYVSIQDAFGGGGSDGQLLGLFQTDNAWDGTPTWTRITSAPRYCDACWYSQVLAVDPLNANLLYAGGLGVWKFDGTTWTEIDNVANGIHVDQHSLLFAGTRLIAGNDGGVWSTTDAGANWVDHNTTLATIQFYDGSLHPTNAAFALGASQDNGTEKWTGANAWNFVFGGDGADNAISSKAPDTNWAVSFQGLGIMRTTNGGASFIAADSGIDHSGAPFIARLEKCPSNDNVFIAGTDNLWRSINFFSGVSPSWASNGPEMNNGYSGLAFAASDTTCNTYAFGTSYGQLRLTSNGGSTWTDIDPGNAVPNRAVTDVVVDPTNANVLYVTLSGFDEGTLGQAGHIFKTTNALAGAPSWANISPPVNIPFNTIVVDPASPSIMYAGSDLGVWTTSDGGTTWIHMGPEVGMPNVAVFELKINDATNRLVAFTHGRSAFALQRSRLADLEISSVSDSPDPVAPGTELTYLISVTNNGPSNASGVAVIFPLPQVVSFISGATVPSGSCTLTNSTKTVRCNLGSLVAGASYQAPGTQIVVRVRMNAAGTTLNNRISVVATEFDPYMDNNSATATTTVMP